MDRVSHLDNTINKNAWRDNMLRVDIAARDEFLRLHNRCRCSHAHQRAEIACRLVEKKIAKRVADLALDQCVVGLEPRLQNISAPVEFAVFLAFGQYRVNRRRRVERGDTGARGTNALSERALRNEVELDLSFAVELREYPGLAGARK